MGLLSRFLSSRQPVLSAAPSRSSAMIEALESRQHLAVDLALVGGGEFFFQQGATWDGGAPVNGDFNVAGGTTTTHTATFSNVPEHALISFGASVECNYTDGDYMTATVGGQNVTEPFTFVGGSMSIGDLVAHQGSDLTITFTTYLQDTSGGAVISFSAKTEDVVIGVQTKLITVDDEEELTTTVTDPYGQPVAGVALNLIGYDDAIIEPQQTSATTDEAGKAVFDVKGVAAGDSPAVIVAGPADSETAPRATTTQPVRTGSLYWTIGDGPDDFLTVTHIDMHVGQTAKMMLRLKKADGTPWKGKDVDVSVLRDTLNTIQLAPSGNTTDESGFLKVNITGLTKDTSELKLGALAEAKVGESLNPGLIVHVHGINLLILNPQQGAAIGVGGGTVLRVRVVDDLTGEGIAGVAVTAAKSEGPGPMTITASGNNPTGNNVSGNWVGDPGLVVFNIAVPAAPEGLPGNYEIQVSPVVSPEDNMEVLRVKVVG